MQFLHPGLEHGPDDREGTLRAWNRGDHRRKFLRSPGRYMDGAAPRDAEIVFWGEWEPQSRVAAHLVRKNREFPRYVHEPFLDWSEPRAGSKPLQNTDPFVFGSEFLYTCCQQYRDGYPTQLANLLAGSVILFGSHLDGAFVLDTVFVVASSEVHSSKGPVLTDQLISETYRLATIERIYSDDGYQWRLYRGATPERRVDEMFSFFPCQLAREEPLGFARPRITLPEVINPRQKQSYKLLREEEASPNDFLRLWRAVVQQVFSAGCELGVEAALPPMKIRLDREKGDERAMDQEPHAAAGDQPPVAPVERPIHPAPKPGQKKARRVKTTRKTLAHTRAAPKKAASKAAAITRKGGGGLQRTHLRRKTPLRTRSRARR